MAVDPEILKEFNFYKAQPEEWKKQNNGKFVLIKNQEIYGIFENYADALQEGVKKFVNEKFLIYQVGKEDVINYNTFSLIGMV
jgi:predicted choloylglycine hydrolase